MTMIQIDVPAALAERLQRYKDDLPRLLESALDAAEHAADEQQALDDLHEQSDEERIMAVLHEVGAVGPTAEEQAHYLAERELMDWQPLTIPGPPVSDDIIRERRERWGEEG